MKLFFKSVPKNSAYFAGTIDEVPESLAKEFIRSGHAIEAEKVLPNDFPSRAAFIKKGLFAIEEIRAIEVANDFGADVASKVKDYLSKLDKSGEDKKPAAKKEAK